MADVPTIPGPPHESYSRLFLRFLRFGLLAWGGPVAQIDMIRHELVERERWVTHDRFLRTLAVYQVLPGPEAHELCVYFGLLSRGRLGGVLAGLGFMLPGFVLMLLLSWLYAGHGIDQGSMAAAFAGVQPAVVALIVRAIGRIGSRALTTPWLGLLAALGFLASVIGLHFLFTLGGCGALYASLRRRKRVVALVLLVLLAAGLLWLPPPPSASSIRESGSAVHTLSVPALFVSGLRTGLLTFGGAYTAIPFLQHDAVVRAGFMTNREFLDGIALGGVLPAPLIIFGTFVGYIGGGVLGALALTVGIFLPAFSFTLVGHEYLERAVHNPALHDLLDGVTAGVVGLIAATTLDLARSALTSPASLAIFAVALLALILWRAGYAVAIVMLAAALAGWLWLR
ncbi:MAG TPA: chromate efflux transporter [Terriglobales bacterium]|nr:chromate efflux transporter [Terriglobales bacterium]